VARARCSTPWSWVMAIDIDKLHICSPDEARLKGVFPNRLAWIEGEAFGALVVYKGTRGNDFALGRNGLDYLAKAQSEGRIKQALVLLMRPNAGKGELLGTLTLEKINVAIASLSPLAGQWGEYWWLPGLMVTPTSVPF
jgi:hypothetical protein